MRVTCKTNLCAQLPESYQKQGYSSEYKFPIVVGQSYIVYGMILSMSHIEYLVLGNSDPFPEWMPAELFEITDSKLSRHWYCGANFDGLDNTIDFVWGYKELADHSPHFDLLVDRDGAELEIFTLRRGAMDLEFPDSALSGAAEILEGNWVLCPKCSNAWESQPSLDALVRCPSCGSTLINPNRLNGIRLWDNPG